MISAGDCDRGCCNPPPISLQVVLADVEEERVRQDERWGEQHHPDGTGSVDYSACAGFYKTQYDIESRKAEGPKWATILLEEVYEACAEWAEDRLRTELVQVAAVCCAWVEDIDSRSTE